MLNELARTVLKPTSAQCSISILPENVKKQRFSDVFSEYRNGTLD